MKRKSPQPIEMNTFGARVATAWDGLIGVFSPRRQLSNIQLRQLVQRSYAGARVLPSQKNYWDGGTGPNDDIRADRQKVANRVRQLARDMPWMNGAIDSAVAYRVGEGFNFRPAVVGADGKMDRETNRTIKDAFLFWCEKADANGRDCFQDLQGLAVRQMIECGEALYLHRYIGGDYRLLSLEPDCIDSTRSAENIDQGIEYDPATNRFIRYHLVNTLSTPSVAGRQFQVSADNVVHLFRALRPWQRRGISPLVQTILIAGDLEQYLSGELSAQQMASRWLAIVTDPNADSGSDDIDTDVDNLTIETLPPGKSVNFAPGADRPTLGLETFQKIFLRILSVILHVPYSVIAADWQQLNYNTLREVRNNTVHTLKPEWSYLTRHFLDPVYRRWMDWAVLSGSLRLPGYDRPGGREKYQRCFWMPPGIESVDVLRDIKGVLLAAQAGMYDPQDWIMSQGEDPDEVLAGLKEHQDLLAAFGIQVTATTSDANIRDLENADEEEEK